MNPGSCLRWLVLALLVVGCAGGAESSHLIGGGAPDPVPGSRLRVLTYNIHHGEGTDGRFDLARIARVIQRAGADVVALQEVDRGTRRASGADQPALLAEALGCEHAFAEAMPYDGGSYGEAILTRHVPRAARRIPISAPAGEEPRAAVEVGITPWGEDGPAVRCIGTHLSHVSARTRLAQVAELKSSLESDPTPSVLLGDFNFTPRSGEYILLTEGWADAARVADTEEPTFPSAAPERRIDYVFLRPADRWKVVSVRVVDESVASDHRPLLVELELLPAGDPAAP